MQFRCQLNQLDCRKLCMKAIPFHLMHLSKTLLDGTAHHVRADSTSDHRSKHAEKVFGGLVRVTGTEIGDEYRRDIYQKNLTF